MHVGETRQDVSCGLKYLSLLGHQYNEYVILFVSCGTNSTHCRSQKGEQTIADALTII